MRVSTYLSLGPHGFHRIAYTDWGDPHSRHAVICVHGLTRNARDFDRLAESLADASRVVCPDVAGRGDSEWLVHAEDYGYPVYLADMAALIARLGVAPEGPLLDWVGTSMGGLIGMMLAAQPNSPIRRLVLNDVGPFIPQAGLRRIAGYVGQSPRFADWEAAERHIRAVSAGFGPLADAQWRHLTAHSVTLSNDGSWKLKYDPAIARPFLESPLQDVDLWDVWQRVRCPVLVLRGQQSDLLPQAVAEEMVARHPSTQLVELPGIGHAPALMASEQIDRVRNFLLAEHVPGDRPLPG